MIKTDFFKKIKAKRLQTYLTFLSIGISIVSTILLIFFLHAQVNDFKEAEYSEAGERTLNQSIQSIQRELDNVNFLMQSTQNNDIILSNLQVLDDEAYTPVDKYEAYEQLRNYLFFLNTENKMIEDILIITSNNQYSSSGNVTSYDLNGVILDNGMSPETLYTEELFLDNILLEDDFTLEEEDQAYLNGELFFATNIYDIENNHRATTLFILDTDSLVNSLLAPENYHIMYEDEQLFKGSSFASEEFENNPNVIEGEIYPFNLHVSYNLSTQEDGNVMTFLLVFLFIIIIVYVISYILSKYVARTALRPIYGLLNWIRNQDKSKSRFQYDKSIRPSRLSFRDRLFSYFLVTILIPMLLISGIYYVRAYNDVSNDLMELRAAEHESKTALINSEIDRIRTVLANYVINPELMRNLHIDQEYGGGLASYASTVNVDSVAVYNQLGDLWFSTSEFTNESLGDLNFLNEDTESRYLFGMNEDQRGKETLYVGLPFLSTQELFEGEGTVIVSIESQFFNDLPLVEMVDSEMISIEDTIYWELNDGLFRTSPNVELSTNGFHAFQSYLNIDGWVYSSLLNVNEIQSDIAGIFLRNAYIYFIAIIILFIFSYYLTGRIIKPFSEILAFSQKYDHEALERDHSTAINNVDEIYELRKNFNESIIMLNKIMEEKVGMHNYALREEYEKKEIQLIALQNQVNPHFLYNSLENLLYLVEMEQTDRAVKMISSLAQFFQFVTNRETMHVPIRKEIEFTKNYLEIMQERFDNFDVEWDVDLDVLDLEVIKLILQPIVENTIHHGVRHTDKLVHLYIKIVKEKDTITFMVADNASGIEKERLIEIQKDLDESTFSKSGIFNINDRLNLYYGDTYTLQIDSKIKEGTKVTITIPLGSKPKK